MIPRLIVHRSATPFVSKYDIHAVGSDKSITAPVAWASRRRLSHSEEIVVYRSDDKSQILWTITLERQGTRPRFFVKDHTGRTVGMFTLGQGGLPIGRSIQLLNPQERPTFTIAESSSGVAIFRRVAARAPLAGRLRDTISSAFDYHLSIHDANRESIGKYRKIARTRDSYEWQMNDTAWQSSDWRVIVSALITLDDI